MVAAVAFGWAVAFALPIGSCYLTGASIGGSLLVIVVFLLAQYALARVSGVVGVLATVAGTCCWLGHLRGIRRDLETGRGAM